MQNGLEREAAGNCSTAVQIFRQILQLEPDNTAALCASARIWSKASKHSRAMELVAMLEERIPDGGREAAELHRQVGEFCLRADRFEQGVNHFSKALQLVEGAARPDMELADNIKVDIARCWYAAGGEYQDAAIQLLSKVIEPEMKHEAALLEYAVALLDRSMPEDAIKILLQQIVTKSEDKRVRSLLARALQLDTNLEFLYVNLPPDREASAPALAFLALVVKDYSAMDEAIMLYRKSCELRPESASYALNLVHTLEVGLRYEEAVDAVFTFCRANPQMKVRTLDGQGVDLCCSDFLGAIEGSAESDQQLHEQMAQLAPHVAASIGDKQLKRKDGKPPEWSEEELMLLALFFTLAKIWFVTGKLEKLVPVVAAVEAVRGSHQLHLTNIRNENAYWCWVSQMISIEGITSVEASTAAPLYVVGDSHSLSPAWRTVQFNGEPRLLHNRLVTGLKAWHLRPESKFFPKYNMECALAQVPDNSQAVFIFGEIDCREGLLLAVEKSKKLEIFVHPVNSVINETRHIVKQFNATLAKRLRREDSPQLHWLDFFEGTLTADGSELRSEFNLDETHAHPAYLELLGDAMDRCK